MGRLTENIKHAFAVDPPGAADPTPEQQVSVDWLCKEIARRHLTTPALAFFEMSRPLNYLASQVGHALAPGVWALFRQMTYENYQQLVAYLEHRGSVDYICRRIEYFEQEFEQKKIAKKMKKPKIHADREDSSHPGDRNDS